MNIKKALTKNKSERHYELLTHPDPRLSQKSIEVNLDSEEEKAQIQELAAVLIATMRREKGAGLAAIQIGIAKRIFAYEADDGSEAVIVNPRITYSSDTLVEDEEGCLSIPALYAPLQRSERVVVEGYNQDGEAVKIGAEGFLARVFQHEIDHLNGEIFINHLPAEVKKHALREYFDLQAN